MAGVKKDRMVGNGMKVLITGASSGIGECLAIEYAKLGYDLILVARNKDKLNEVKNGIGNRVKVEICSMDLTNIDNCKKLYDMYRDIDILINNAGFGLFGEFSDTDLSRELAMIDTNVRALHCLMKLYLNDMVKKDRGQILNVASIAGFMPGPLMSTYYATKNYVVSLSEGVREELRKRKSNVKISILCPGPVRTNFDTVAGVSFSLKGKSSEYVARYTVKKLGKGKFYIVPGVDIKFLRLISGIVPNSLISIVVYYQQRKKYY